MAEFEEDKLNESRRLALDTEHRALVDDLKRRGELPEDFRYEWNLPKKFRKARSKASDKAALAGFRGEAGRGSKRVAPEPEWSVEPDAGEPDEPEAGEAVVSAGPGDAGPVSGGYVDDDPDSIAWNKAELKRLREMKQRVSDDLMSLEPGDKDGLALCKQKLSVIESQESACQAALKLFNAKKLAADENANKVLIVIEDHTGDVTGSVQVWA